MTPDPTQQPDALQDAEAAELSVREQLDELLIAIEQQEPGTVQSDLLPASYRLNEDGDANGSQPSPAAQPQASAEQPLEAELEAEADDVAQAMAEFEQALGPTDDSPANALNPGTDADVDDSKDELAAATVESDRTADVGSDARAPAPSQTREPATAAEADMLAALNAALTDLGGGMKKDAPDQPAAASAAPSEQDPSTNDNVDTDTEAEADTSTDADVQAEIDALLSAEPISTPQSAGDDPAANASAQVDGAQPEPSTEDQIAQEIENLLSTASASPPQADPASASLANPNDDPADIGDLDKMLADEIDLDAQLDSDLAGDFQSVDAVTAGIQIDDGSKTADDPHAASARDVAAELDTQPEGVSSNDQTFDEDPFAAIAAIAEVAEKNEAEHQAQVAQTSRAKPKIDWPGLKQRINAHSLRICYAINYPARRYLTHEWRETLGLISLTVACSASLFFIAVLIFG